MNQKKQKDFDCVEMKREAQRRLQEEYEARRDEFSSYIEFISAKADSTPWVQQLRAKRAEEASARRH